MKNYLKRTSVALLLFFVSLSSGRSIHRPQDPHTPYVEVQWINSKKKYTIKDKRLRPHPFFGTFDNDYLKKRSLPKNKIIFRNNPKQSVSGQRLDELIKGLITEIKSKKKRFSHFEVITSKNFNFRKRCGILIAKFKKYPFIVKLFIETPKTFVNPNCKGFEPIFLFPMGGGVNRHLSGFTRIKNLESVRNLIKQDPYWSKIVDTPRKWFWCANKKTWIKLTGVNFKNNDTLTTQIPGTYAVVADAIEAERKFSVLSKDDRLMAMSFCNYIDNRIDPHIDNFLVEKGQKKIVVIDTEHFPTIVGLHEKVHFKGYTDWYLYLMGKCFNDWFFWSPKDRRKYQVNI